MTLPHDQPGAQRRARPRRRGFTLIETMVVVGIAALLGAMTFTAVVKMRKQGAFAGASTGLLVALRQVRSESYGRGNATVFVIDTVGKRYWTIVDKDGDFDLDTFVPATPAPAGDVLLATETLAPNISFGPSDGFGATLPAPWAVVPANVACTFCRTAGTNAGFGAVIFNSSGGATFLGGAINGSFTLQNETGGGRKPITFVINGRTGATQTFDRS